MNLPPQTREMRCHHRGVPTEALLGHCVYFQMDITTSIHTQFTASSFVQCERWKSQKVTDCVPPWNITRPPVSTTKKVTGFVPPRPAVRSTGLFKLEIGRNWKKLVQKPNWTETEGQKWKCVLRYTDFLAFPRSNKQKVRVPEYTFSLLPLSLRPIWLLHQNRPISIFQLK